MAASTPTPATQIVDDVIAVRVGDSVRIHGYTADREDGYCREVTSDMKRARLTCDVAELHFTPDGETTLATVHRLTASDLTWEQFAANLTVLPCGADAIAQPTDTKEF